MKAVQLKAYGGADQLFIGEAPTPEPGPDELLVRVASASVNRADILQRQGKYPPPSGASEILGLDIAGEVVHACGDWKPGDKLFGLVSGGAYAEFCTIHRDMAMPLPRNLTFDHAAAIPEVFLTAFQSLFLIGNLRPDQTVLIHAGASGVGTAAIQLVRLADCRAIVTTSSTEKIEMCRKLGAAAGINYKEGPFAPKVLEATAGRGVDVVLDFIGASYFKQNLECLATDGRIIVLSTLGGSRIDSVDLRELMKKRAFLLPTTLRNRSLEYKIDLTKKFSDFALTEFRSSNLEPVVDKVFPWEQVADAHRYVEENRNIGKVVLKIK